MIMTRSHAIATGVAAAAVLTATGITYATAVPAPQAQAQVAPAAVPAQALMGGEGGNTGKGNEGNERRGNERGGNERGGKRHHEEGRIHINEREYSGRPDGCITVVSGLGAKSFNIRNDSRNDVEVFRGAVCDNGAPIATVGPHSSANNVRPGKDEDENCEEGEHHKKMDDGVKVKHGVVASFRVIKRHHDERGEGGEFGDY
ncbi:hypothetical protein [Streptomyces sp. NBC_01363]|uniref:hypothetical protein n=1 Tax=Streptomyces sp. NBC_01363 TaxID=2903840 RepID=UPI002253E030|nr:hypothetical protein [Streptomyces sp. NBC_01363]MCX4733888.1 hypothetical protein [Streptomyces sp. NBC_01363]